MTSRPDGPGAGTDRAAAGDELASARTPPASWYVDPAHFERERERVFRKTWQAVARADQLALAGRCVAGDVAGEPWVAVRSGDGVLRAFYNVCRHHAARLVDGETAASELVCPYHGWTYGLDGRLLKAPRLGPVRDFDPAAHALVPLRADAWGPFVAVNGDREAAPLARSWEGLDRFLDPAGLGRLRFAARRSYELKCNWKVYVDNYLDGGYHVQHLHRGLAGLLDLDSYRTGILPGGAVQHCAAGGAGGPEEGSDFRARIGSGAVYAWLYPNFMINRYGSVLDTNLVLPLAVDRTRVVFEWWFEETEGPEAGEFDRKSIAASERVQDEDTEVCESVQRGLASAGYRPGPYAVPIEAAMHAFHRRLEADLA